MATVAAVANSFGTAGWQMTDLVSAHHNTYLLSFEAAPKATANGNGQHDEHSSSVRGPITISAG